MATDFQDVYRYNAYLCSSVVSADVLEENCNPAGENELILCFASVIRDSSVLPPELHRGKNVDADCWFP